MGIFIELWRIIVLKIMLYLIIVLVQYNRVNRNKTMLKYFEAVKLYKVHDTLVSV